ncbi:DUF6777 domain-containing protein [Streptomyces sp. NPDC056669]|uniref:DUF6777 domain-containing protein n=1 Tax=unclassified Streptomyces TaxID=2593676 RepID=UPI0036BFD2BE
MRSISWHLTSRRSALFVGFVVVVAVVVVLGMVSSSEKASGKASRKASGEAPRFASTVEYRREPVGKTSVPAFTSSFGHDRKNVVSPSNGGRAFRGDTPGLYAGVRNRQPCDRQGLTHDLDADKKRGAAWSRVQHIGQDDITGFVQRLTSVTLRSDTYAKTYGYRGGVKPVSAVLQAGTAVFVDEHGAPVVKCDSGNPVRVSAPPHNAKPTFTGPQWNGFSRTTVTVIRPATKNLKHLVLVETGKTGLLKRPLGDGDGSGNPRDTVLARADYPSTLAMPGEQHAPRLREAPKVSLKPSDRFTPLETDRPSGPPSQQSQPSDQSSDQPTDPGQQPQDQPTDPGQQQPQDQPSDPGQQQPQDQPSDPGQQQPQDQPTDPGQQQQPQPPPNQPPPNQPPPNQPPPNQPPPNQPPPPPPPPNQPPPNQPPPNQPPPNQPPQDQPQQQPDPNQQQPPPSGP